MRFYWIDEGAASYKFGSVVIYAVRYSFPSQFIFVCTFRRSVFPRSPQANRINWVQCPATIAALLFAAFQIRLASVSRPRKIAKSARNETIRAREP